MAFANKKRREIPNKQGLETIEKMKELRQSGYSYHKIADILNTLGFKTKTGNAKWHPTTVMKILKRESMIVYFFISGSFIFLRGGHMKNLMFLLSCALIVGCASKGFNRGALRDQLGVKAPVVTDAEIAKTLKLKPNLPKPFKLGVYFKSSEEYYRSYYWRWTDADKDIFLNLSKDASQAKMISEVFQILPSTVSGKKDIKSIRLAAARHGADAVLIISGAGEVDRYANNLGWTYILLATTLFVPGSEADTLFMANASLWDVRNEYLYLTAEAESQTNNTYIVAYEKENKELLKVSKDEALKKLKNELLSMVKGIKKSR